MSFSLATLTSSTVIPTNLFISPILPMIVDGLLTYGNVNGDILSWRFSNDILNELVLAVLLTIISYQAAEMFLNLCFGIKRRGQAKLRDLQIMLLIRKSSPIAIARVMLAGRRNSEHETEDDDQEPDETGHGDKERTLPPLVYGKLLVLLMAIPLVNITTVVLSLERDTTLTIAEANFGGLALGLDLEQSLSQRFPRTSGPSTSCEGVTLQTSPAEFAIADFNTCIALIPDRSTVVRKDTIRVTIIRTSTDPVFVEVTVGSKKVQYVKRGLLLARKRNSTLSDESNEDKRLYFVPNSLSEEGGQLLASRGLELAKAHCDSTEGPARKQRKNETIAEGGWKLTLSHSLTCLRESERSEIEDMESARGVAFEVMNKLQFVNSDELLVRDGDVRGEDEAIAAVFSSGNNLLLVKRRRGFVSIPLLAIAALGVTMLRMLSELLTKNDLERGIGLILRDGLGLPCCDSMLCSSDVVVRYSSKGSILYAVEREHNGSRDVDQSSMD